MADALGLKDAVIKGIDFAPHSSAEEYREAVTFIKNDPLSLGALVTTHKIDLFNTCKDLFEYVDPYAERLGEVSSISKKGGKLCAHAKDPISSGWRLKTLFQQLLDPIRRGCAAAWSRRKHSCYVRIFCAGAVRR